MTIEELAAITQREYEGLRNEMVTRHELQVAESNILRAIDALARQLAVYMSRWNSQFDRLADRLEDVDSKFKRLEADCQPRSP